MATETETTAAEQSKPKRKRKAPLAKSIRESVPMDKVMGLYSTEGATAAAKFAGVSKRTVQRWASEQGVKSGYVAPIEMECPSAASYTRGCRCEGCRLANKEAQRETKKRRIERFRSGRTKIKHGVSGYSNWDCRCEKCRKAWSAYLRKRRQGGASRAKVAAKVAATAEAKAAKS